MWDIWRRKLKKYQLLYLTKKGSVKQTPCPRTLRGTMPRCVRGLLVPDVDSVRRILCWSQEKSCKHANWPVTTVNDVLTICEGRSCRAPDRVYTSVRLKSTVLRCKTKLQNRMSQISQPHNLIWMEKLHPKQGAHETHLCTWICSLSQILKL